MAARTEWKQGRESTCGVWKWSAFTRSSTRPLSSFSSVSSIRPAGESKQRVRVEAESAQHDDVSRHAVTVCAAAEDLMQSSPDEHLVLMATRAGFEA